MASIVSMRQPKRSTARSCPEIPSEQPGRQYQHLNQQGSCGSSLPPRWALALRTRAETIPQHRQSQPITAQSPSPRLPRRSKARAPGLGRRPRLGAHAKRPKSAVLSHRTSLSGRHEFSEGVVVSISPRPWLIIISPASWRQAASDSSRVPSRVHK